MRFESSKSSISEFSVSGDEDIEMLLLRLEDLTAKSGNEFLEDCFGFCGRRQKPDGE